MSTPHRPVPASTHSRSRRTSGAVGLALGALLAVSACSSGSGGESPTAREPEGLTTGIPDTWAAGIDDGMERYPDLGSMGMGDLRWACPLVESVTVGDEELDELGTTFWKLDEGVHELECSFYEEISATLRFAQAEDETAFAGLVEATDAFEQSGNEQVQDATTIGERDYVLVTWTYPTNDSAGAKYVACYLDETTLSRACLELHEPEKDGDDFSGEQAAEILSDLLAG